MLKANYITDWEIGETHLFYFKDGTSFDGTIVKKGHGLLVLNEDSLEIYPLDMVYLGEAATRAVAIRSLERGIKQTCCENSGICAQCALKELCATIEARGGSLEEIIK